MFAFGAAVVGVLIGVVSGSDLPVLLLIAGLVAPAVIVGTVLNPSFGLLVLVLLVFTHFSDVAVSVHGMPSVLQPYLLLLLVAVAAHAAWRRTVPSGLTMPAVLLSLYGLVLSLSLFFATDFDAAYLAVNGYVRDAIVCLLVVALVRRARHLERVTWVLVISGGLLAALGVAQYLTGSFGNEVGGFAQASVKNIAGDNDDWRISGPIADPNHWAQALLVVVPLALGRTRASSHWTGRVAACGALAAVVLAIVFTYSRGALLALAIVCLVAVVLRPPPVWVLATAAVGLVLGLQSLPVGYTDRLGQLAQVLPGVGSGSTGEASLSGRLSAVLAGQRMIADNPVVGVGVGQFTQRYRDYALGLGVNTAEAGVEPHNMYLEVAAETGYLGVVTWGALLGLALFRLARGRTALRRAGWRKEADLIEDLGLGLVAYLLGGMFVHNAYPRLYWLLIGAALAVPVVVREVLSQAGPPPQERAPDVPAPAVQDAGATV